MAKNESALQKVADFFGGVTRYDSKDHPESAPMMNKRKDASQGPAKGPFKTGPATPNGSGMKLEKSMQPISKQGSGPSPKPAITKTKAPRY